MLKVTCVLIVAFLATQLPLKSLSNPLNVKEKDTVTDVDFKDIKISNITKYKVEAKNTIDTDYEKNNFDKKPNNETSSSFTLLKRAINTTNSENLTENMEPLTEPIHEVVKNTDTSNNVTSNVNSEVIMHTDKKSTIIMNISNPNNLIKNEEFINRSESNIFQKSINDDDRNNYINGAIPNSDAKLSNEPIYEKLNFVILENVVNEKLAVKSKQLSENIAKNIITEGENDIFIPEIDLQINPAQQINTFINNSINFEGKPPMEGIPVTLDNIKHKQDKNTSDGSIMEIKTDFINSNALENNLEQIIEATSIHPVLNTTSPIYVHLKTTNLQENSHNSIEYFEDSIKSLPREIKKTINDHRDMSPVSFTFENPPNVLMAETSELIKIPLLKEILNDTMSINIVSKEDFHETNSFAGTNFQKIREDKIHDEINKHTTQATRKEFINVVLPYISTGESMTEVASMEYITDNISVIIPRFQNKIKELDVETTSKLIFNDNIYVNTSNKDDFNAVLSAKSKFRKALENNDFSTEVIPLNNISTNNTEIISMYHNSNQENINTPTTEESLKKDDKSISEEAVSEQYMEHVTELNTESATKLVAESSNEFITESITEYVTEFITESVTQSATEQVTESHTQKEATSTDVIKDIDILSTEKCVPAQANPKKGRKIIFLEKILGSKHRMRNLDIEATFSHIGLPLQPTLIGSIDGDLCNDTSVSGKNDKNYVFIIEGKSPTTESIYKSELYPIDVKSQPSPPTSHPCCSGSVCYGFCDFLNPQPLVPMIMHPPPVVVPYSAYFQGVNDPEVLAEAPYHSDSPIFLSSFESDSSVEVESS